jgi:hypothetical protein
MTLFCGAVDSVAAGTEGALLVRINNQARFEPGEIAEAEAVASADFSKIGIPVEWQNAADVDPNTPDSADVVINLVAVKPGLMGGRGNEVGMAAIPETGRASRLCWVFRPTLETIVDDLLYLATNRNRPLLARLVLGHVIAHEIGHILLGSREHSGSGLMTLGWGLRKLQLASTGRLGFLPAQAESIPFSSFCVWKRWKDSSNRLRLFAGRKGCSATPIQYVSQGVFFRTSGGIISAHFISV